MARTFLPLAAILLTILALAWFCMPIFQDLLITLVLAATVTLTVAPGLIRSFAR